MKKLLSWFFGIPFLWLVVAIVFHFVFVMSPGASSIFGWVAILIAFIFGLFAYCNETPKIYLVGSAASIAFSASSLMFGIFSKNPVFFIVFFLMAVPSILIIESKVAKPLQYLVSGLSSFSIVALGEYCLKNEGTLFVYLLFVLAIMSGSIWTYASFRMKNREPLTTYQNNRRIWLIEKGNLTQEEAEELERLQKLADEWADSIPVADPKRIAELHRVYDKTVSGKHPK